MDLETVVEKLSFVEVEYDNGETEIHDTTCDQLLVLSLEEATTGAKRTRVTGRNIFTGKFLLRKLENADSAKPGDIFLTDRAEYWRELYSDGKVLELNLGVSSASRYGTGLPWEERIKGIPLVGDLVEIPNVDYLAIEECKPSGFGLQVYTNVKADEYTKLPAVGFSLVESEYDIILVWIEQRKEWTAFKHHSWMETGNNTDESEQGPYALDDYCKKMLSRAYKLDLTDLSTIAKTSPRELGKIYNALQERPETPIFEFLKASMDYNETDDIYYLKDGDPGYGEEVLQKTSGAVTIAIPGSQMSKLVTQSLSDEKGRLEIQTSIEDRLGSPGYPDYQWYENSVKQYYGKAVILMEIIANKPRLLYELPEHDQHEWSGW